MSCTGRPVTGLRRLGGVSSLRLRTRSVIEIGSWRYFAVIGAGHPKSDRCKARARLRAVEVIALSEWIAEFGEDDALTFVLDTLDNHYQLESNT